MTDFVSIGLIAIISIISIGAFSDARLADRLKFNTYAILREKQWDRLVLSAFIHADYMHLIFNMLTLYFFSNIVIYALEPWGYLTIFFAAVVGGGLLSLLINKDNPYYTAVGASGGVVGILFAAIAINPHIGIMFFFIPIPIPGWVFAILYLGLSIYGMKAKNDNIGHEAHLGGAIIGIIITLILVPNLFLHNMLYIGLIFIPIIILAVLIWKQRKS